MNKIKIAMAVTACVLALGVAAVAFAQTPEPQQPTKPEGYGQTFWQLLADKLGVTVEKLQAAVRDALKGTVDKMLADGKLTQSQADKAKAGADKMSFDKPLFGQFWAGRKVAEVRAKFVLGKESLEAAAAKLGMTTQDLMAALRDGKSLADLAKEKSVKPEDLKAAMVAAINAQIDQAVKDGKLTQEQADKAKANAEKSVDLDRRAPKPGPQEWFRQHRLPRPGHRVPAPARP